MSLSVSTLAGARVLLRRTTAALVTVLVCSSAAAQAPSGPEQRTYMTLWCIARSPLMLGANLTAMDPWTMSLLDNPEVIAVDQLSGGAHQVLSADGTVVWVSRPQGKRAGHEWYVATFNLQAHARTVTLPWKSLSLTGRRYAVRDLWSRRDIGQAVMLRAQLPAHGAALYLLSRQ